MDNAVHSESKIPTGPRPLTATEKQELIRAGQWGDKSTPVVWYEIVQKIKSDRGGVYPPDWHEEVICGKLFEAQGEPNRAPAWEIQSL